MILYLDTSALVKLFVEEPRSDRIRAAVAKAQLVATHAIAYVEACAAFARLASLRNKETLFAGLRRNLDSQWRHWDIVAVTEPLVRRAADLAGHYHLRGYDSMHFAAAEATHSVFKDQVEFRFAVFDSQLREAAGRAGIPLIGV